MALRLEGEVPTGYRGDPDYGRDWLEREHYPRLSRVGFLTVWGVGLAGFNGWASIVSSGMGYAAPLAAGLVATVIATLPTGLNGDRTFSTASAVTALLLAVWVLWLGVDFEASGAFHRHLVATFVATILAWAWHDRRRRYAWWMVIPTSDAWDAASIGAYAEFLVERTRGPYDGVIARELFRVAADLALKPAEPNAAQLDAIRRYVSILRDGIGGFPNFGEARWWKDKLNEFEDRAREERQRQSSSSGQS